MHISDRASVAFAYLFNSQIGLVPLKRISEREVSGLFPDPFTRQAVDVTIPFHEKDQRTLIVFDGDIPWQGVSRHTDQALSMTFGPTIHSLGQVRKDRPFEEPMPSSLSDGEMFRRLMLTRHFLLMPAGSSVMRRYVPENLGGRYSLVTVERDGPKSKVYWQNSSY